LAFTIALIDHLFLIPVAPSGVQGIRETPPPGPVNSQSFNFASCLHRFHGFILNRSFPALFETTAPSSPLRVPVQYRLLYGSSGYCSTT
jgi:hypothetical protein